MYRIGYHHTQKKTKKIVQWLGRDVVSQVSCAVEGGFGKRDYGVGGAAGSATELAGLSVPASEEDAQGPLVMYESLISSGQLRQDARQESTVMELERLYQDLIAQQRAKASKSSSGLTLIDASSEREQPWWRTMFQSQDDTGGKSSLTSATPVVKGLYLYGGVGCGKTMLMDMFASSVPRDMKMERIHFHDFMLDVHELLQEHRDKPDPLAKVARDIASKSKLICLDELFVNDIADASILHRLFDHLWARRITLVATSNRHPDALYEGGLQRQLFLPFIERLKETCVIHDMESERDYRKLAHHASGLYFTSSYREDELEKRFVELSNQNPVQSISIDVEMGRKLTLHRTGGCIAYETFSQLCEQPLGAADYMALAAAKHTLALSNVPVFDAKLKTAAYRFVTLIDILYENRIRLLCSAEAEPDALFEHIHTYSGSKSSTDTPGDMVVDDNLGFVKDRTISRLIEMQSSEYLVDHAKRHAPELLRAMEEDKEAQRKARYSKR